MSIIETPRNQSEKTLACLVVDRSGSMTYNMDALNAGIRSFLEDMKDDERMSRQLETAIIAFDDIVEVVQTPDLAPFINYQDVTAGGTTALVAAIRKAIEIVEERKDYYKANNIKYKLPWIVVVTDGGETEQPSEVGVLAQEIETATKNSKFMLLPIAVGDEAFAALKELAGYKKISENNYQKLDPVMLNEARFSEFFQWLSASMTIVSQDQSGAVNIQDPESAGWGTFSTM